MVPKLFRGADALQNSICSGWRDNESHHFIRGDMYGACLPLTPLSTLPHTHTHTHACGPQNIFFFFSFLTNAFSAHCDIWFEITFLLWGGK